MKLLSLSQVDEVAGMTSQNNVGAILDEAAAKNCNDLQGIQELPQISFLNAEILSNS